jgi:putative phosphoesterase
MSSIGPSSVRNTATKIALVADIHGNLTALEAVVEGLANERLDQIICLGDVASTGPQPHEVLVRLRALGWPVVMGNADAELLAPGDALPSATEDDRKIADISRWCAAQLADDDRAFLASFQPVIEVSLGGGKRLLCCHGSPRNYDEVILASTPDEELEGLLNGVEADVFAGGHTHRRMLRSLPGREFVNPGSVGLAYEFLPDGGVRIPPWAELAVLTCSDGGALSVDFRRLPYDREATVRAMHERAMPHAAWWAADWR